MRFKIFNRRNLRLNIGPKIIGGFSIVIVLMLAVSTIGYLGMKNFDKSLTEVNTRNSEDFYWSNWKAEITRSALNYQAFFSTGDERWLQEARNRITRAEENQAALSKIVGGERILDFQTISGWVNDIMNTYQARADEILLGDRSTTRTAQVINEVGTDLDAVVNTINATIKSSQTRTARAIKQTEESQSLFTLLIIGISGIALLAALAIGILVSVRISSGVKKVKGALQKMAAGDLTVNVSIKDRDEVGDMALSYNDMQKKLSQLVSQFKQSAVYLNNASEQLNIAAKQSSESTQQVATSAQQMARGAQEQSNNAQETAKSIEQL
ncbi:MAG TPA: methyl-accepting chemotaxis protein, partial [Dehalococcoidales bacterium]|nr:methyl-accepting chemotaxis protein [Dehalococcoidales bacterium]